MINLTHNEDSAIDIGGIWVGPNEFEFILRFNEDDKEDVIKHLALNADELETLIDYLNSKLKHVK